MGTENVLSNEESGGISELDQKIIRQVEYYFGDYNLRKDKFLSQQVKLDNGWIPLATMITFNRLKSITQDFNTICEALKKSTNELMEVNEDSTKIRRKPSLLVPDETESIKEACDDRTLYVKGFKKNNKLDELLDFFKEHRVEHIYMRRRQQTKDKPFKGSCFVMFCTNEDADKFLETKGIKYENTELLKEKKKDYMKRKDIYYQNLRAEKEKKLQKKAAEVKEPEVEEIELIPGCLIKICDLGPKCSREAIKEVFSDYGNVVFVDYYRGNPEAVLRFDTGIAASVLEKIDEEDGVRKLDIGGSKATISVIEGDSEKEYWKSIAISKANARLKHSQYQKQNKGRFNKKSWGKRSKGNRRDDENTDQPPSKRQRFESREEKKDQPKKEIDEIKEETDGPPSKKQRIESREEKTDQPKEEANSIKETTEQANNETGTPAAEAVC